MAFEEKRSSARVQYGPEFPLMDAEEFTEFAACNDAAAIRAAMAEGKFVYTAQTAANVWLVRHTYGTAHPKPDVTAASSREQHEFIAAQRASQWAIIAAVASVVSVGSAAIAIAVTLIYGG